ncbi:serine-threonine protein kinase [Streptomyces sp. NPDC005017]|uniref:serine-threonine protein kinase n=1 Tax=Streptomyces sp. NPDC005017 TaxID=3364706 RepID=UPI00368A3EEF
MAAVEMSVAPYWELTFDADGDADRRRRERFLAEVARRGVTDLVLVAHGWNNDRSTATGLYSRFLEPFPALAPGAVLGYAGVVWPSMRFPDEPIPDFPRALVAPAAGGGLDGDTLNALLAAFPGRADVVERLAALLGRPSRGAGELDEFGRLVRLLVEEERAWPRALTATDTTGENGPAMLTAPVAEVCEDFARGLAVCSAPGGTAAFSLPDPWDGAQELLRQATYYAMKQRAGTVGELGLGPVLGQLAEAAPRVRVHLVGHSFGARLVAFALRGLPRGVRTVRSVTLLQGAFSHYAFAERVPGTRARGALHGCPARVDGPLVCCHSRHDSALGTMYPLASRMAGDDRSVAVAGFGIGRALGARWGAVGFDGIQALPGTRVCTLADAVAGRVPASGCVNVDVASVVRRGGPPAGAHSDIVHRELAQVVVAAGRIG